MKKKKKCLNAECVRAGTVHRQAGRQAVKELIINSRARQGRKRDAAPHQLM